MAKLDDLETELETAKTLLVPQIEGLHDFARLNLQPETLNKVNSAITDFERRLKLINEALTALDNLKTDDYPVVAQRAVIADVYTDLKQNVSTIEAAFSKFAALNEAVAAEIMAGAPHQK